jgi:microcystin-dependent protein
MSSQFLGELRLMSFNFPPKTWALCDGQLMSIAENQALFSLLGTTYGGDGQTTFALPDLRGRTPIHRNDSFPQGTAFGEELHTLTASELPAHNHVVNAASSPGTQAQPATLAASENTYRALGDTTTLHPSTLADVGGSQSHENRAPYLVLEWCIAIQGIFPSRN